MEELILKSIEEIKPFLQRDGGDIEFIEYTDDHITPPGRMPRLPRRSAHSSEHR